MAKLTIAQENGLPGENNLANVEVVGAGDPTNQGFCREFSVNVGELAHFACDAIGEVIDVYRIGWYGGQGWRKIATLENTPTNQPDPTEIPNSNGGVTCTAWADTASWQVPMDATPGLYVGVLRDATLAAASWIPFIVRDETREADLMFKVSDSTWALAYNYYGNPSSPFTGKSFYGSGGPITTGGTENRAHAATYHKPIVTREGVDNTWMHCEAPLIRYLERMGFDVTYSASKDWREGGDAPVLPDCRVYLSVGHDEYWSQGMRDRWTALRAAGKHLLFMSGNEVFWRTRYTDAGNVMWCFKDTMPGPDAHVAGEPLDPVSWTGSWRDGRWPSREPENELTGMTWRMNGTRDRDFSMVAGDPILDHPFWRHTNVATEGITVEDIIGGEADEIASTQPDGSVTTLAKTTVNIDGNRADDNGQDYTGNGDMVWGVIAQRFATGALVVGFGTWQWPWGLDSVHDRGGNVADSRIQQATLNLLVDLGADPTTPMAGLILPTAEHLSVYGEVPLMATRPARLHRRTVDGAWDTLEFGGTGEPPVEEPVPITWVYSVTVPSIVSGLFTRVSFTTENADNVGGWSDSPNPHRITIMEDGIYRPFVGCGWASHAQMTLREHEVRWFNSAGAQKGSATINCPSVPGEATLWASAIQAIPLVAGDYVELWIKQKSGAGLVCSFAFMQVLREGAA